jgi:hypothetical protein
MPVSSSTLPAPPPQHFMAQAVEQDAQHHAALMVGHVLSFSMRSLPQRSQVTLRNHDGNARIGSVMASAAVGSGSVP